MTSEEKRLSYPSKRVMRERGRGRERERKKEKHLSFLVPCEPVCKSARNRLTYLNTAPPTPGPQSCLEMPSHSFPPKLLSMQVLLTFANLAAIAKKKKKRKKIGGCGRYLQEPMMEVVARRACAATRGQRGPRQPRNLRVW